jgi:hypothetical protein
VLADLENAIKSVAAALPGVPMMLSCFVVACNALHERLHPELVVRETPLAAVAQPAQPGAATSSVWVADKILDSDESFGNTFCSKTKLTGEELRAKLRAYEEQREARYRLEHDNAVQAVLFNRAAPMPTFVSAVGFQIMYLMSLPTTVLLRWATQSLVKIDLSRCRLKALPHEISLLANLEALAIDGTPGDIHGNQLSSLPDAIDQLVKLKHLSLANNRIVWLPQALGRLPALESLWLNNNSLLQLPKTLSSLQRLRKLVVCDNLLQSLPSELHVLAPSLKMFVFSNNPLRYPPQAHDMTPQELLKYMRTHPNDAESVIKVELSGCVDDSFADLHLDAPGGTVRIHQAMAWARATEARGDACVPLWRNAPPLPPSGAPSGTGPLVITSLSADEGLLRRFATFLYSDTLKSASDSALTELLQVQGVPRRPTDAQLQRGVEPNVLGDALGRLLSTERFADITIRVGDSGSPTLRRSNGDLPPPASFRAHRFVLAARSPYFAALLKSGMAEATAETLHYPDIDSDAFKAFLFYLYRDELDLTLLSECSTQALVLGARFGVERFVSLVQQVIVDNIDVEVACSIYVLARVQSMPALRHKLKPYMAANFNALMNTADWSLLSKQDIAEIRA